MPKERAKEPKPPRSTLLELDTAPPEFELADEEPPEK